ncbi:MAG: nucleotidyltransferase domain-containing protein [Clostridium sp.]|nr:nucleotidyltransferase domain-containing protein [Clostridium sp.]
MRRLIETRRAEQQEMVARARRYTERLRARIGLLSGFVVGSVARGDFNLWSDVDLVVIANGLPEHPLERSRLLYDLAEGGIEPKGYTVTEFRKLLAQNHPLALETMGKGILLLDELGVREISTGYDGLEKQK